MNKLRLSSSALLRSRSDFLRLCCYGLFVPRIHHLLCFAVAVIPFGFGYYGLFVPRIHHLLCFAVAVIPFGLRLLRSLRSPSIIHHLLCFAVAVIPFGLRLLRSLRSPSIIHHLLCFAVAVIHNNSGGMFHPPPFFVLLHCFVHGTSDNVILLFFCQLDEVNCIT